MAKVGLVVNPIAGMGGRVGLKGTDGVLSEAMRMGAKPISPTRIIQMLESLKEHGDIPEIKWLTASGPMGQEELEDVGFPYSIVHEVKTDTSTAADTEAACTKIMNAGAKLLVFCGGDGTARNVYNAVANRIPVLGIPAGVKMHSGVFAMTPEAGAEVIARFLRGEMDVVEGEVMDLDEGLYRQGKWNIKLYGLLRTPHDPNYIQTGKEMVHAMGEDEVLEGICEHISEEIALNPHCAFILGSGSTLARIGEYLDIDKTLLGIDVYYNNKQVLKDCNEKDLIEFLKTQKCAKLVISPIGGQGFILGRGNQQLSPEVIKLIGLDNIIIVATPAKINTISQLRVDLDDDELRRLFNEKKYMGVVTGYRYMVVRKVKA